MMVLGCDPGTSESALVAWDGATIQLTRFDSNEQVLSNLRGWSHDTRQPPVILAVEQIEHMGMPAGKDIFETVRWAGRFEEAYSPLPVVQVTRRQVKLHLCGSMKAKDANVRQALIDRFGPKGTKGHRGVLYPLSNHLWSAFAIALTHHDQLTGARS